MRIHVDERFSAEVAELGLVYRCVDCVYFLRADGTCAHEWPNEAHLAAVPEGAAEVEFCKEFETA